MWRLGNIIDFLQNVGTSVLLYSSDAEKAFDRVQWSFLKAVLQKTGFGDHFMRRINLIYSSQKAEVWIEGC